MPGWLWLAQRNDSSRYCCSKYGARTIGAGRCGKDQVLGVVEWRQIGDESVIQSTGSASAKRGRQIDRHARW